MNVNGNAFRTIWLHEDGWGVTIIDQTRLPHEFEFVTLRSLSQTADAISRMLIRGAPLIGATAAYGFALHMRTDPTDAGVEFAYHTLLRARPTAVNLRWALDDMRARLASQQPAQRAEVAYHRAADVCDEDVETNRSIGAHGLKLLENVASKKTNGEPLNILTHCNAGWLATVDWGTATAPIYMAHDQGINLHVWVGETRPRNQGASLTAFELSHHGVPHTVVTDNLGGHLMQHGKVDMCLVGTDRTAANGDVCNKIGTYLKALAAHDNKIPFYVALPSPTIDWNIVDGIREIPIEQRDASEVSEMRGRTADGRMETVNIVPDSSPVANFAFDVTPARLIDGLITERGIAPASTEGLAALFPEYAPEYAAEHAPQDVPEDALASALE